jgi:hypothetical protein
MWQMVLIIHVLLCWLSSGMEWNSMEFHSSQERWRRRFTGMLRSVPLAVTYQNFRTNDQPTLQGSSGPPRLLDPWPIICPESPLITTNLLCLTAYETRCRLYTFIYVHCGESLKSRGLDRYLRTLVWILWHWERLIIVIYNLLQSLTLWRRNFLINFSTSCI